MAIVINDGIVSDSADPWVEYFVLDLEIDTVYEIAMNGAVLEATPIADQFEVNTPIVDGITGLSYYLEVVEEVVGFALFESQLSDLSKTDWDMV